MFNWERHKIVVVLKFDFIMELYYAYVGYKFFTYFKNTKDTIILVCRT